MTSDPLISVHDLAGRLSEVSVLDVRYRTGGPGGRDEHAAGHVPGARYVDLDDDLAGRPGPRGRHPLPDPDRFAAAMRRVGVDARRRVVVYDDWEGRAASRLWWLLRHHGHDDVAVLDGGWRAWAAAGQPVATGVAPDPAAGDFTAGPGRLRVVGPAEVPAVGVLVDARAPERHRGDVEPIDPVAGHVPGAVNVPTTENVNTEGRFRSPAELREVYAAAGVVPGTDAAAYCGSGVTACHDLLAMQVAGIEAALYPGSWSEWVSDPERPVGRG